MTTTRGLGQSAGGVLNRSKVAHVCRVRKPQQATNSQTSANKSARQISLNHLPEMGKVNNFQPPPSSSRIRGQDAWQRAMVTSMGAQISVLITLPDFAHSPHSQHQIEWKLKFSFLECCTALNSVESGRRLLISSKLFAQGTSFLTGMSSSIVGQCWYLFIFLVPSSALRLMRKIAPRMEYRRVGCGIE